MKYALTIQTDNSNFQSVNTLIIEDGLAEGESVEKSWRDGGSELVKILEQCGYSKQEADNIVSEHHYFIVNCDDIDFCTTGTIVDNDGREISWEEYKRSTTYEEVAEQIYDDLQHNRITTYKEYKERLDKEKGGAVINEILHNKWSFGFCDMCGEYINYDDDPWYDVQCAEPEEREILEETLPIFQKEVGHEIQDVCPSCWHKLLRKED